MVIKNDGNIHTFLLYIDNCISKTIILKDINPFKYLFLEIKMGAEDKKEYCEYFLGNRDNDKNIFYLRGEILFCAKQNCAYGNQVSSFLFEGEKPEVRACKTNGLKKTEISEEEFKKKLEEVIKESGLAVGKFEDVD